MPSILIPNIEEAFFHNSENNKLPEGLLEKLKVLYARFLLCAESGDYIVTPEAIDGGFIDYLAELKGEEYIKTQVIAIKEKLINGQLAELIANNDEIMETFKNLKNTNAAKGSKSILRFEPFIASENIVKMSEKTNIFISRLNHDVIKKGIVNNLNNKIFVKNIAKKLGIQAIPGVTADNADDIKNAVTKIAADNNGTVMIKKPDFASGLGNLGGTAETVLMNFDSFYDGGEVIIERLITFKKVIGALVNISNSGAEFIGLDEQLFTDGCWCGFSYPAELPPQLFSAIKNDCLKLGNYCYKSGLRGELNLDFVITEKSCGNNEISSETNNTDKNVKNLNLDNPHVSYKAKNAIIAAAKSGFNKNKPCHMLLETNFRHNGFGLILKYAADYFGTYKKNISYIENFNIPENIKTFNELKELLSGFLISGPDETEGIIIAAPPFEQKCSLIFAADSKKEIAELIQKAAEEINCAKN